MLWRGRKGSSNVEDRRGLSTGGVVAGGGLVGIVIYLLIAFLGGDPSQLQQLPQLSQSEGRQLSPEDQAADAYVINSCTVTHHADRDARSQVMRYRRKNPNAHSLALRDMA